MITLPCPHCRAHVPIVSPWDVPELGLVCCLVCDGLARVVAVSLVDPVTGRERDGWRLVKA